MLSSIPRVVGKKVACCEIFDAIITSVNLKGKLKVMHKLQLDYDKLLKCKNLNCSSGGL